MELTIKPKKVIFYLGTAIAVLGLADIWTLVMRFYFRHDYVFGLVRMFNVDREMNVPAFFSVLLIFLCACILLVIAAARKQQGDRDYAYWALLSAIFFFLSIDELASIHESISGPLHKALQTSGYLTFAWIIPYGALLLILSLCFFGFLFRLPSRIRNLMAAAGVIYVSGAIGFEFLEGFYATPNAANPMLIFAVFALVEELLEMCGMLLFLHALMKYAKAYTAFPHLRFATAVQPIPVEGHIGQGHIQA